MSSSRQNLNKLKELCDALTDRDMQLKANASALWDILEIVSQVKARLTEANNEKLSGSPEVLECLEDLAKIECIIDEKGCKRVQDEH